MSIAERLARQLESVRQSSEKVLDAFKTPEDWTRQVVPGTNHAMWFAGHMATADNFFISQVAPEKVKTFEGWDTLFGMGSKPTSDPDDYPPVAEVVDAMRERRAVLLDLLRSRSDAELSGPPAAGASDFLPDLGSVFEIVTWHEVLHMGQVTVIRRALGHQPVMGATPEEANA